MGRLENIIERNRNPKANRERLTVGIGVGLFLLLIICLMLFTDLGLPGEAQQAPAAGSAIRERRLPDVQLRRPATRPAPSAEPPR